LTNVYISIVFSLTEVFVFANSRNLYLSVVFNPGSLEKCGLAAKFYYISSCTFWSKVV